MEDESLKKKKKKNYKYSEEQWRLMKVKCVTQPGPKSHLQTDDTLSCLHLLLIERPLLLVCILHADVDACLAALSLGLMKR